MGLFLYSPVSRPGEPVLLPPIFFATTLPFFKDASSFQHPPRLCAPQDLLLFTNIFLFTVLMTEFLELGSEELRFSAKTTSLIKILLNVK